MCDVLLFLLNRIKLFKRGMLMPQRLFISDSQNWTTWRYRSNFYNVSCRNTAFTLILMTEQFDNNISGFNWLVKFISPLHLFVYFNSPSKCTCKKILPECSWVYLGDVLGTSAFHNIAGWVNLVFAWPSITDTSDIDNQLDATKTVY